MSGADADDGDERGGSVREQDRFLPIANISRIMKKALPPNAKIAKDAKETVQECVSEFISFITSECGPAPLAGSCLLARPSCHAQVLAVSAVDMQALHTGGSADKTTGRMPCMPCLPAWHLPAYPAAWPAALLKNPTPLDLGDQGRQPCAASGPPPDRTNPPARPPGAGLMGPMAPD